MYVARIAELYTGKVKECKNNNNNNNNNNMKHAKLFSSKHLYLLYIIFIFFKYNSKLIKFFHNSENFNNL